MENKTKRKLWVLDWKVSQEELDDQVSNYETLSWSKSYRKILVGLIFFSLLLTTLLGTSLLRLDTAAIVGTLIIYLPFAYYIYRGRRWAIIGFMILWTFEKGYSVITAGYPQLALTAIIYWFIYMQVAYKALIIENSNRKDPVRDWLNKFIFSEQGKRSSLITILCVLGFIGELISLLVLSNPYMRDLIMKQNGFFPYQVDLFRSLLGLIGLIGYWKMHKWGVYIYTTATIIWIGCELVIGTPDISLFIFPFIIIGIGFVNLKNMTQ
ncbi:MAG: hypothetical protein HY225_03765 [Candidatus Vogelbacteria bacterium]|nr:hypothetical protein [Candidatus Vogelbacteria bacterium]